MKNDDDLVNDLYLYTCEEKKEVKTTTVTRKHRSDEIKKIQNKSSPHTERHTSKIKEKSSIL